MRNSVRAIATVILISAVTGCGSAKRGDGTAELQRVLTSVHDLNIVVTTGTNQIDFSRRLTDALLKIGDMQQSESKVMGDFPKSDQAIVSEIYQHFGQAVEAYKQSQGFFGDMHKERLDPFDGDDLFGERKYEALYKQFPNLDEVPLAIDYSNVAGGEYGGKEYWKGDMLQALWKEAAQEEAAAKQLIDQLNQQ